MQKKLLADIRKNRAGYQKRIVESIKTEVYECERYKINLSIAIGETSSREYINEFSKIIRATDKLILLDDHICCMIFPFTDIEQGIKAASNLLSEFETKHFSEKIYLGIVNIDDCTSPAEHVGKLFDILEDAISNGMSNMPLNITSF